MVRNTASIACTAALAALATACGATQKSNQPKVVTLTDQPPVTYEKAPQAQNPAPQAGTAHLELAEMSVLQGDQPILKVHADGTTEMRDASGWHPGPTIQADGTILVNNNPAARVNADGSMVKLPSGQAVPVTVTADGVTVKQGDKETGLALAADGTISVVGAPAGQTAKITVQGATTPGQRKAVMTAMIVLMGGGGGAQSAGHSGGATPAPPPPPAPPAPPPAK